MNIDLIKRANRCMETGLSIYLYSSEADAIKAMMTKKTRTYSRKPTVYTKESIELMLRYVKEHPGIIAKQISAKMRWDPETTKKIMLRQYRKNTVSRERNGRGYEYYVI